MMHQNKNQNTPLHVPVLLQQTLHYLAPKPGDSYLDLTAGYGGHAQAISEHIGRAAKVVLIDRDPHAQAELQHRFPAANIDRRQQDFLGASQELVAEERQFDLILADLGVSSPHLNDINRGFSLHGGPLDMRMDDSQALTASTIINSYDEADLTNILKRYGEEPKANQIAKLIVAARPINDAQSLAAIVKQAWPGHSRVHPATRTFQAIRIAVNDELGQLEQGLPLWIRLLKPGGRIVIISFHSLEDRIVKQCLAERGGNGYDADLRLLTKRPITADVTETAHNPRARSAKLRAAVKIKT